MTKSFAFKLVLAAVIGFLVVQGVLLTLRISDPAGGLATGAMEKFTFADVREPAPDAPFLAPDGSDMSLRDFAGKTVLVNLWATWCAPCVEELPHLDALQSQLGSDQFEVVAISLDRIAPERVAAFMTEHGVENLAMYRDPSTRLGLTLGAPGLPITVLYDQTNREVGRLLGPADWSSEDAANLVRHVLSETVLAETLPAETSPAEAIE